MEVSVERADIHTTLSKYIKKSTNILRTKGGFQLSLKETKPHSLKLVSLKYLLSQ